MKNHWKTLIFATMTAVVLSCGVSAFAVSDVHATVYLDPVFVEGGEVYCWTPLGKQTNYLSYNGTTYIPIRTAGEWMGKNVAWDEASKTITLSGTSEKVYHNQTEYEADDQTLEKLRNEGMTVKLRDDIKVVVDGKTQDFKNAKGEAVYPINYNNMNYLPVRNIGELLGMTVTYQPKIKGEQSAAIFMRTKMDDSQIKECENYISTLTNSYSYAALSKNSTLPKNLQDSWAIDGKEDVLFHLIRQVRWTKEQFQEVMPLVTSCFDTLKNTPKPSTTTLLDACYANMMEDLPKAEEAYEAVKQSISENGENLTQLLDTLDDKMSSVLGNINEMKMVLYEQY